MQTQFSKKIKVFQSDGGTEFVNNTVRARVLASYWVDAFSVTAFIINRMPNNRSPFELLHSRSPNYGNFRTFGCLVYPYIRDYSTHKLAPRSIPCIFIGYHSQYCNILEYQE